MRKLIIILCMVVGYGSLSQERSPILSYTSEQHNAQNQNWSISQSDDNYIYVANNGGLLEFDGAKWNYYLVPDRSIVRTVKVIDQKIFTSSFMDFGYWEKDNFNLLQYSSLTKRLQIELLEDEQFWSIEELDDWLLFQSLSRIYIVNKNFEDYKVIDSGSQITKMFKNDNIIYYQVLNEGIYKIENGKSVIVLDNEIVKQNELVNILSIESRLLFITEDDGMYFYDNNKFTKWDVLSKLEIENLSIYRALKLKDNSIALGTISNGLIHLNNDGSLKYHYDHKNGLNDDTVLSIFEDSYQNLWLGLDNGINCINLFSNFSVYSTFQNAIGTIYSSIVVNDLIYLGTNQGLFYKDRRSREEFKLVKGTQGVVWTLKQIEDKLFCGHNDGTFIIEDGELVQIIGNAKGTWDFKYLNNNPNLLIQGNYKGLHILERVNNKWTYKNKIEDFDISSRFFEQVDSHTLLVNREFKGLFKLELNEDYTKVNSYSMITDVGQGMGSSILKFSDNTIYSSSEGFFTFNQESKQFVKNLDLSKEIEDLESFYTLLEIKGTDKLWRFADDNIMILSPGSISSKPKIEYYPVNGKIKNTVMGFQNMTRINDGKYLIGTLNGFYVLNTQADEESGQYEITINTIKVNKIDSPKEFLANDSSPLLENKHNNIEFYFSVPYYNDLVKNKYQYQLIGLSDNWSTWKEKSNHLFENLPFGNYTFNVRAKVGNAITDVKSFSFEIKRPWFLSNFSIAIYIVFTIFLFGLIHFIYRKYYRRQRERLLKKTQRELELSELQNKQSLTEFKNEKLELEVESKSRELAISTMSLIKKNEFLNTIKNELSKVESNQKVNAVLKIIDNNLNNTDDWKLFEEAFNNADKNFLLHVKEKHPELTPNDLKLCAYLRLNLSSKEIAPLLNISPKSVEVKRYRLRKKMKLEHETSLTNYILEL